MRFFYSFFICCCICVTSACASKANDGIGTPQLITGLLLELDPNNCLLAEGCGPRFTLLDESLNRTLMLQGDAIADSVDLNGLVIQVTGVLHPLSKKQADASGYETITHTMNVSSFEAKSSIPYHPFLVNQADSFTTKQYGCQLRWNKSYSWKQSNNRIEISVTLTDTDQSQENLMLIYDGRTGELIRSEPSKALLSSLPRC